VEQIKALKAAHTLEAVPERPAQRPAATIEESVTSRIRNRAQEQPPAQQEAALPSPAIPEPPAPLAPAPVLPPPPAIVPLFEGTRHMLTTPSPRPQAPPPRVIRPPVPARPPRVPSRQLPLF
jgi:hypothetical protein